MVDLNVIDIMRISILDDVLDDGDALVGSGISTDVFHTTVDVDLLHTLESVVKQFRKDLHSFVQHFVRQIC